MLLLYGARTNSEKGSDGLHESVREGVMLLLPLKLSGFELSWPHGASARTHMHPQTVGVAPPAEGVPTKAATPTISTIIVVATAAISAATVAKRQQHR